MLEVRVSHSLPYLPQKDVFGQPIVPRVILGVILLEIVGTSENIMFGNKDTNLFGYYRGGILHQQQQKSPILLSVYSLFRVNAIIKIMADNLGVDIKPIASSSALKNMWEQKIQKSKEGAEEAKKIVASKPAVQVQPPQSAKSEPSSTYNAPIQSKSQEAPLIPEQKPLVVPPSVSAPSVPPQASVPAVEPVKASEPQPTTNSMTMSLKDRMKIWQQVTSPKTNYVSSPPSIPKTVTVQPKESKPAEQVQPAPQPSQPVVQPQQKPTQPSVTLNNTEKPSPPPAAQSPVTPPVYVQKPVVVEAPKPEPVQEEVLSLKPTTVGGVETSFVPASKKIGMWESMLNKNKAEVLKAKEDSANLAKANGRLSYQQPPTSQSSAPKAPERSTYMPESNNDIDLEEILGTKQEMSPTAFRKKSSENVSHQTESPQRTVQETMRMMKEALEKSSKQKQIFSPVKVQAPVEERKEEVIEIQVPIKQIETPQVDVETVQFPVDLQESVEAPTEAPSLEIPSPTENQSQNKSDYEKMMDRVARQKNRRSIPSFDDA